MKTKRTICLLLAAIMILACFAGCKKQQPAGKQPSETETPASQGADVDISTAKDLGFGEIDSAMIEYLKQVGYANENFTVSPLSYKAALALAAMGAKGETQAQLLAALGFKNKNEMIDWYKDVAKKMDRFASYCGDESDTKAFKIANSVWANTSNEGRFLKDYVDAVKETFGADAKEASEDEITDAINNWVEQFTNGLIKNLIGDASNSAAVLVNALYLKTAWDVAFHKTGEDTFTTNDGKETTKEYISSTARMKYYEDSDTRLVVIPFEGDLSFVVVLGDETNIGKKIAKADKNMVCVKMPMFDLETSLNNKELCNYLRAAGCTLLFSDKADLSGMFTTSVMIGDIIQKAKVHIDEDGVEAAAATAVVAIESCAEPDYEEIIYFTVDGPYSFYIIDNSSEPDLIFYGQVVS